MGKKNQPKQRDKNKLGTYPVVLKEGLFEFENRTNGSELKVEGLPWHKEVEENGVTKIHCWVDKELTIGEKRKVFTELKKQAVKKFKNPMFSYDYL